MLDNAHKTGIALLNAIPQKDYIKVGRALSIIKYNMDNWQLAEIKLNQIKYLDITHNKP